MHNEKDQINFNETDIEMALSDLLEIIKTEENNASMIKCEIDNLDEEIINLKKSRDNEDEKANKSYIYFSPVSINNNELYDKKLQGSLYNLNQKKEELNNIYINKMEQIKKLNSVMRYFIYSNNKEELIELDKSYSDIGIKILENKEIERSRIAGDLHDSTVQSLTNLVHRTELCIRLLDVDIIRAKLELLGMTSSLRTIINDMRDIIYDLRPMSLSDIGLGIAIEQFLEKLRQGNAIQIELKIIPCEKKLSEIISITLFRIIQEACNNVIKHANAERIIVTLQYEDDYVFVEIIDNGKGFEIKENNIDNHKCESEHCFGLAIMKERVGLLSGNFKIETNRGKGTKVIINIPYTYNNGEEKGKI